MSLRNLLLFLLALGLALFAAGHRFGDSAHGMGMLSDRGGRAHHPVTLDAGRARYAVVLTAGVLPPWRGDARVTLEGASSLAWEIHPAGPRLPLGLHRAPVWEDGVYRDLRPRDRLALWLRLRRLPGHPPEQGAAPLALTFRDARDGRRLLEVPILFAAEETGHGH